MTRSRISLPARRTVKETVSPGWCARIATISAMPSGTFSPATSVTRSPVRIPPLAAGLSAVTSRIFAPASVDWPVSTLAPITG